MKTNAARSVLRFLPLLVSAVFAACTPVERVSKEQFGAMVPESVSRADTDALFIVDCVIPPEIRQLGQNITYLSPRRPIKTSALECRIRGGEYVAYDRANYETAEKAWREKADEGDPEAQTYMGEIYEKGLGRAPDYAVAAQWYEKAADRGYPRAAINLGYLYEQGRGVAQDMVAAMNWYRKASGLPDELEFVSSVEVAAQQQEVAALRSEVQKLAQEYNALKQQLDQAHRSLSRARKEKGALQREIQDLQQRLDAAEKAPAASPELQNEIQSLQQQVQQKTARLAEQLGLVARLENEANQYRTRLEEVETSQARAVTGPRIELIDPPVTAMRGVPTVRLRSAMKQREIVGRVSAPAGLDTFRVNDRAVDVAADGLFRVLLDIVGPETPVNLIAVDSKGRRAVFDFMISAAPTLPPLATATPPVGLKHPAGVRFGSYYALVIGNNEYRELPKLETAESDAASVESVLREKYGFQTLLLRNADRHEILLAFYQLRRQLTDQDNLLIYYAGHGNLDRVNDTGNWLPVDAQPDDPVNWISNRAITELISTIPAKHVMVVADSCYSGTLSRTAVPRVDVITRKDRQEQWLKLMAKSKSRTVLTSGGLQPVLDVGGGGHSVFAEAFLSALQQNQDILQAYTLYRLVSDQVTKRASVLGVEQVPEYAPIKFSGHETGQFFFVPAS